MTTYATRETTAAPWARTAAHAAALVTLPSGLWRVALVLGVPVLDATAASAGEKIGIVSLSLVLEALALLTLGLVQPWGVTVPRRLPLIGGRRVPVLAATIPAGLGAVALALLWGVTFLTALAGETGFIDHFNLVQKIVVVLCYAPLLAWGPLLGAVTVEYYRRRTTTDPQSL